MSKTVLSCSTLTNVSGNLVFFFSVFFMQKSSIAVWKVISARHATLAYLYRAAYRQHVKETFVWLHINQHFLTALLSVIKAFGEVGRLTFSTGGTKDKPGKRNQPIHGCSCRNDKAAAVKKDWSLANSISVDSERVIYGWRQYFPLILYISPFKDLIKATFISKILSSLGPSEFVLFFFLGLAHAFPDK